MCKKHTRDAEIRPFCPGFCLKSLFFLTFSEKCKNQGSFCKCLITNKVLFLYLTEHGGRYENADRFFKSNKNSVKFFSQNRFTRAFRFFEFLSALMFAAVKPGQAFAALTASVFFCLTKQILLNAVIFYVL